jgi:beta-lactam-binding protein with PASTA domain
VRVAVPDVVGLDSGVATIKIMGAGFKVNLRRDAAAGASAVVASQQPPASAAAPKGSTVVLTVK